MTSLKLGQSDDEIDIVINHEEWRSRDVQQIQWEFCEAVVPLPTTNRADHAGTHEPLITEPPKRSNRVPKRRIPFEDYENATTSQLANNSKNRGNIVSSGFIPPCEARLTADHQAAFLPLQNTAGPSDSPKRARKLNCAKPSSSSLTTTRSKRVNISYSNWSCKTAPTNILSLLRFDHAPELLQLPSDAVIQNRIQRSHAAQSSLPAKTGRKAHSSRRLSTPAQVKDKKRVKKDPHEITVVKPKTPGRKAQEVKEQQPSLGSEIQIVPLPSTPFQPSEGISSSKFCMVLRILARLPKPRQMNKEFQSQPLTRPPVWAESRQELCEALPYYRSFQSGLYMHKRVVFGYLLEAFPAPRDIWAHNGKVVISHGGGQCIRTFNSDGTPGPAALQADQSRSDARVDALMLAHERKTPIILIAGKGYEGLPWELDCAYAVLGWYWISLTWVEAEPAPKGVTPPKGRDYFHRVKIRFDWVQPQGEPWWINPAPSSSRVKHEQWWTRGSSPLTPLPSDDEEIIGKNEFFLGRKTQQQLSFEKGIVQSGAYEQGNPAVQSPKLTISSLLNPTELPPTPPHSSPEKQLVNIVTPPSSPCDIDTPHIPKPARSSRAGHQVPATSTPIWTVDETSLKICHDKSSGNCSTCHQPIYAVYQEGLICLRPECKAFFMLKTSIGLLPIPPGFRLTYHQDFLKPIPTPMEVRIPYDVVPPEPIKVVPEADDSGEVGGRTLWRGWVCRRCGRANCRYKWEVWECRNCGNTLPPINPASVVLKKDLPIIQPAFMGDSKIDPSSGISSSMKWIKEIGCVCMVYDLPSAGKVYHLLQPRSTISNELLEEYQIAANSGGWFQRRPLRGTAVKGQLLAQHFAVNFGASYKYQVDTLSYPFSEAPKCVMMSLALITHRVKLILGEEVKFNEILSVMYREGQKMSWHDDGEAGLGPIVSSLSLGNQAIMSFKLKTPRTNLNNTFYNGVLESKGLAPTSLSFTLSHGDIMIMQGGEIQKKYDHKVIPMGFRIASTARVIGEV